MAKLDLQQVSGDIDYTAYNGTFVSQKLWCGDYPYYVCVTFNNLLDSDTEHNTIATVYELEPNEYEEDFGVEDVCSYSGVENWSELSDQDKLARILDYATNIGDIWTVTFTGNSDLEENYQENYDQAVDKFFADIQRWHDAYA